jgi:hypothetical protein
MTPVGAWARRAATLPAVLVDTTPGAVGAGAEVLESRARANLLAASGGDLRLSGARSIKAARGGGSGQRVDVTVKLFGTGRGTEARVRPVGPVSLIEGPTRAHRIPFAYGTGRRYAMAGQRLASGGTARRKRANRQPFVWIPGVGFRTSVQHPGTKGKRPVQRAFTAARAEAGRAGLTVFAEAIERHLTRG